MGSNLDNSMRAMHSVTKTTDDTYKPSGKIALRSRGSMETFDT